MTFRDAATFEGCSTLLVLHVHVQPCSSSDSVSSDRWTFKFLALPIFDEPFAQAISESPLSNLAFVAAMGVSSGDEFVDRVSEWSSSLGDQLAGTLLARPSMLEQFWTLASKAEKVFMGCFGLCEGSHHSMDHSPVAKLRQAAAVKALLGKPTAPTLKGGVGSQLDERAALGCRER